MTDAANAYRLKAEAFLRGALATDDLNERAALIAKANYWHRKAREAAELVKGPANPSPKFASGWGLARRAG